STLLCPAADEDRPITVVMIGDSTTLCSRNPDQKKVTDFVQARLRKTLKSEKLKVINSGQGSDTAKGGLARLDAAVLTHKPDLVAISFGLNDTIISTPAEFDKSLRGMIEKIQKETKAKVLLLTSTPFDNQRHSASKTYASKGGLDEFMDAMICARMRSLSKELKVGLCDLHTDFKTAFKKDRTLQAKVIMEDGVHLTDQGNELMAKYLVPKITEALKRE